MFFIRHSRLFSRKELEEYAFVSHKRSEGRLKRYESCTDSRAWSLDRRERASYFVDFMTSIARAEDALQNREKALEGTSSQTQNKEIALKAPFIQRQLQNKEKALKGTSSERQNKEIPVEAPLIQRQNKELAAEAPFIQRQNKELAVEAPFIQRKVLPPGDESEYISEAIEHVGVLHGESDGADLQSGNLPSDDIWRKPEEDSLDDISEASVERRKFSNMPTSQTTSQEKSDEAVQSKNFFEDTTIIGEDETLPLDHIKQESLIESFISDISESSIDKAKFTKIAALKPNPDAGCRRCSTKKELPTFFTENTFYGEDTGVYLRAADVKVEKESDHAVQSNNIYEDETIIGEDETLPLDHIKQESLVESFVSDISESSIDKAKFTKIAALKPNTDAGCRRCSTKKEVSTSFTENKFYDEHNGVYLRAADVKVEKESDHAVQSNNLFEDETIREENRSSALDHIKQKADAEKIVNDVFESSLHGGKPTRIVGLRPNPADNCVCSAAKELISSSKVNNFYSVSFQPTNIKLEKKSDELLPSTKGSTFYSVSLHPAYIKEEKKSDESFHKENLSSKKNEGEDEKNLPLDHIKQESVTERIIDDVLKSSLHGQQFSQFKQKADAEQILNDVFESSLHGEKFTQIAALKPNPEMMTMAHEYLSNVARESTSLRKEDIESYNKHVLSNEPETYSQQSTSTEGLKKLEAEVLPHKLERDPHREQMDLQSATCTCMPVKKESFVRDSEVEYRNFVRGSPSSSSKSSVKKEENTISVNDASVLYLSYSRSPTITVSETSNEGKNFVKEKKVSKNVNGEQRDPQTAVCSCNTERKPGLMQKTEKLSVNGSVLEVNMMAGSGREMKGNNNNMESSQCTEDATSFESDSDFCKQRIHACREAKQIGTASKETAEVLDGGIAYYLIPFHQTQRPEYSFSEKELKRSDSAKQSGQMAKKNRSAVDVPAFEPMSPVSTETKKEEELLSPYGGVNSTDDGNRFILMDASQYAEEYASYKPESTFSKQHMCACKEAKKTESVYQEEVELPGCGRVYFLVPISQAQGTELNETGKEGKICGDKVSPETPVTDIIHFNEHLESHDSSNVNSSQYAEDDISFDSESDCCKQRFHACREAPVTNDNHFDELEESLGRNGNIHPEMAEKLVRSFDVERKFYKEQMDTAIRKLNDQIKEIENLRLERDSLKTNLDTAQHYIDQHKQAINKLNSMRKVDEQLSRENELLLKKIYQLSHTAFNQQTKISKLKTKLKQKSRNSSYIQDSYSTAKDNDEFQPVHVLYPTSQNNLNVPYKSVFLESYSQYPLKDSASDAASRYNNMTGNGKYSFNHINTKGAFVEQTVNHVHITSIMDHSPQNKKYLDLKKTIRREKDDLVKVTKLIQFQQGVISNLSNCIDNERMLLSELNSARRGRKLF